MLSRVAGVAGRAEVRDAGPSVPAAERSRLFTFGAQLPPRPTAGEESHGLAIVKHWRSRRAAAAARSFRRRAAACFGRSLPRGDAAAGETGSRRDGGRRIVVGMEPDNHQQHLPTQRKPSYPVKDGLRNYLRRYRRDRELPVSYEQLRDFHEAIPLTDAQGKPTLWDSVIYRSEDMNDLYEGLKHIYAMLRVDGDLSVMQHLYVDRVDFCSFGNSTPFRIRVVNAFNDNQDYFYVKKADASRVYGLELEHLLSPNRLNFFTSGNTLIEEHIVGIPGDIFIARHLNDQQLKPIRIAKELVKFNERCFVRLLGDMRSYNFVAVITPDFEEAQIRIRAMDFDQQSYHSRKNFYLPQFFRDNAALAQYCIKHLNPQTALQYQREEHALMMQRAGIIADRLKWLLGEMAEDPIAPVEHVHELRVSLAEHYQRSEYLSCETMGSLIQENLETIRLEIGRPARPGSAYGA